MTDLGTLGGPVSAANDIDQLGRVIGFSLRSGGDLRPVLWDRTVPGK
jgi:hypothetical protein